MQWGEVGKVLANCMPIVIIHHKMKSAPRFLGLSDEHEVAAQPGRGGNTNQVRGWYVGMCD